MSIVVRLEHSRLQPEQELADLLAAAAGDGAIVSFVGVARSQSQSGQSVDSLVLDHHPSMTERSLHDIAAAAAGRFAASHVRVAHRCGEVGAGEPIVFAGAASAHRRSAFEAADYLMDRLKTEAVLWKREVGDGGSVWIEPSEADYADRDRWS